MKKALALVYLAACFTAGTVAEGMGLNAAGADTLAGSPDASPIQNCSTGAQAGSEAWARGKSLGAIAGGDNPLVCP